VLVSILILSNLLIGSDARCQELKVEDFEDPAYNGAWPVYKEEGSTVKNDKFPVYKKEGEELYMFRVQRKSGKHFAIGPSIEARPTMLRKSRKKGIQCGKGTGKGPCKFTKGTGDEKVSCPGQEQKGPYRPRPGGKRRPGKKPGRKPSLKTDASAMMQGDAVTEESASGSGSADLIMMAAGAAIGGLLVAVAVAVVVAMRKRKSAKRTEMEMTEAVHVPDSSVMTPDATEKKAEGDEEAVTVHSSHVAEVTVSVSMDDEAVQVDA